jgi:hypothetical protein
MRTKKSSIRRIINPHESTDGFKSEQVMDEWIDFDDTKRLFLPSLTRACRAGRHVDELEKTVA